MGAFGPVRFSFPGLFRLVLAYFFSHDTIKSAEISRLLTQPAAHIFFQKMAPKVMLPYAASQCANATWLGPNCRKNGAKVPWRGIKTDEPRCNSPHPPARRTLAVEPQPELARGTATGGRFAPPGMALKKDI